MNSSARKSTRVKCVANIILLFLYALLWSCFLSSPFNIYTLHAAAADVDIFLTMAKGLLDGQSLYVDLWDHKGPLLYYIYLIPALISRNSHLGVVIFQSCTLFVTLLFAKKTAELFLKPATSILLVALLPLVLGSCAFQPAEMVLCLQLVSFYLFARKHMSRPQEDLQEETERKSRNILVPLTLCATATLYIKLNLCAYWGLFILYELYALCKNQGLKACTKQLAWSIGLNIILSILILVPIDIKACYDTYITYNFSYGKSRNFIFKHLNEYFGLHLVNSHSIFYALRLSAPSLFIGIGLYLYLFSFVAWPKLRQNKIVYLVATSSSLLMFSANFSSTTFYPYYFASLHVSYILTLIFTLYYGEKLALKSRFIRQQQGKILILGSSVCAISILILSTSVHDFPPIVPKKADLPDKELRQAILKQFGAEKSILFIYEWNHNPSLYVWLDITPPISRFYKPPAAQLSQPEQTNEMLACINARQVKFVATLIELEEPIAQALEEQSYIEIPSPHYAGMRIFQREEKTP